MSGIFRGLAYLHDEKNIIHRDLKPGNILVGSYKDISKIKLIDFGLAIHNKKENIMDYEHCGTLLYQPPEQAFNQFNYGKVIPNFMIYIFWLYRWPTCGLQVS